MSKEKIYIFDTTLRDGAQTQGIDFSICNTCEHIDILLLTPLRRTWAGGPGSRQGNAVAPL